MRDLSAEELVAITARAVSARDLVRLTVRDRETGDPVDFGFWSDAGPVSLAVIDALTGAEETLAFAGGALVSVGDIQLVSDLSVRTVDLAFSAIDGSVEAMIRTYDPRGAPVQIWRAFLDPETHQPVAPARARFVGFVDEAPIVTAAEGGASKATLACVSHARELTRVNPDVRSHESQIARAPGDAFYKDTGVVGSWEIAWGKKRSKAGGAAGGAV